MEYLPKIAKSLTNAYGKRRAGPAPIFQLLLWDLEGMSIMLCMDMEREIQLLQFFISREFSSGKEDTYTAEGVHSNLYVKFPYRFQKTYAVTCWKKDRKFHKEVLEYSTDYGVTLRSPHMDIEPVTNSVLFRWHKHLFPPDLVIEKPTILTIRVTLDWKVKFESYLLIEQAP